MAHKTINLPAESDHNKKVVRPDDAAMNEAFQSTYQWTKRCELLPLAYGPRVYVGLLYYSLLLTKTAKAWHTAFV